MVVSDPDAGAPDEDEDDCISILEFPLMVCPLNTHCEDTSDLSDCNGTILNEQVDGLLTEQAEEIAVAVNNYHLLRAAVKSFLLTNPFHIGSSEGTEGGKVEWIAMTRTSMNDLIHIFMNEV